METSYKTELEGIRATSLAKASADGVFAVILSLAICVALFWYVNRFLPTVPFNDHAPFFFSLLTGLVVNIIKSAYFVATYWQARRDLGSDRELGNKYATQLYGLLQEKNQNRSIPAMLEIVVKKMISERSFQGFSKLRYYHAMHNNFKAVLGTIAGIVLALFHSLLFGSPTRNGLSPTESLQLIWPLMLAAIFILDSFLFSGNLFGKNLELSLIDHLLHYKGEESA